MQFDVTTFLLCRAIAENADPDTPGADRLALVASMLDLGGPLQSALLTSALARGQAPATNGETPVAALRTGHRRRRALASPAAIKVPSVRHLNDAEQIHAHLQGHKLRPVIHREMIPEIKVPRVLRQWPEADSDAFEGADVNVLLLVPEGAPHAESESRPASRR